MIPNDVVGEELPSWIGPLETTLVVQSFEHEWTTATYKKNLVHVEASAEGSKRSGGVVGTVEFTVTEDEWRRLCGEAVATDGGDRRV